MEGVYAGSMEEGGISKRGNFEVGRRVRGSWQVLEDIRGRNWGRGTGVWGGVECVRWRAKGGGEREVFLEWQVKCGDKWKERFLRQEVWSGWGGGRWRGGENEISRGGQRDRLEGKVARSGVQ